LKKNGEDYARFSWQNYSLGGGDKGVPEALELRPNEIHNLETKKNQKKIKKKKYKKKY